MTAAATQVLASPGGIVAAVDLWFPGQQDPVGPEQAYNFIGMLPDPLRYVVWVQPRPPSRELAPRVALHCNGCQL